MNRDLRYKRVLKVSAEKALKAVSDFEKYIDFVPGCTAAESIAQDSNFEIGRLYFNFLGKQYFIESRNEITKNSIKIEQIKGPFIFFNGEWSVIEIENGLCEITFYAEFELPFLLNTITPQPLIEAFSKNIIESFIEKAH